MPIKQIPEHKTILLELRASGLTVADIAQKLGVKSLQIYRYQKSEKIPSKRLYQLKQLQKQIEKNKSDLSQFTTEKILNELTRRGLKVKID